MENTIKIKIYGPQGSGKTRMAEFVADSLRKEGYSNYRIPYSRMYFSKRGCQQLISTDTGAGDPTVVQITSTNSEEEEVHRAEADRLRLELREKTKEVENLKDLVAAMRMEIADKGAALNQKDEKRGNPKAKKYRLKHSAEGYFPPYHRGVVYPINWDPQQDGVAPARLLIARYPEDWEPVKSEI